MADNLTNLPERSPSTQGRARLVTINGSGSRVDSEMALIDANGNVLWRGDIATGGWEKGALPGMNEKKFQSSVGDRQIVAEYKLNYTPGVNEGFQAKRPDKPTFSYADGTPGFSLGIDNPSNMGEVGDGTRNEFRIHPGGQRMQQRGEKSKSAGCIKIASDAKAREFIGIMMALPASERPASMEIVNRKVVPNMDALLASGTGTAPAISGEDEQDKKNARNTARDGDAAIDLNGSISAFFIAIIRGMLPGWLGDLIFGDSSADLNEAERDTAPVANSERVRNATSIRDAKAVPKWKEFQKESGSGEKVLHSNPVRGDVTVTSSMGARNVKGGSKNHKGLDLVGGNDILASADGIVLFSGKASGYGNLVVLGHADGTETRYAHMTGASMPKVGELAKKGEQIGVMGKTGNSTGVHLHYEQRVNGVAVNPMIDGQLLAKGEELDTYARSEGHARQNNESVARNSAKEAAAKVRSMLISGDVDAKSGHGGVPMAAVSSVRASLLK